MDTEKNERFEVEKDLVAEINAGRGFNIYEIKKTSFLEDKNKINYGSKVNIAFLEKFFNPEIGLSVNFNTGKNKSNKIKKSFYFIGRKNFSKKYENTILFQDKSLLGEKDIVLRDFCLGGNIYGGFFKTGFYFKKIAILDKEMPRAVNSFIDAGNCSFFENSEKQQVATTVLEFAEKLCNLNMLFDYQTPLKFFIKEIKEKKVEKTLLNCPEKMRTKILNNLAGAAEKNEKKELEFIKIAKDGTFNTQEIADIFLEYRERSYFFSKTINTFFIVEGKDKRIFLLDFFEKPLRFSRIKKIINSYSELAELNEKFIGAFAVELFLNEKS